ncbi:hypothetical protein LCGC14_1667180, partial [marine sediment metagenome]
IVSYYQDGKIVRLTMYGIGGKTNEKH